MKNHGTRSLWGTLSKWLRGKRTPETAKRATLAKALDAELFRRELSLLPSEPEEQQRSRVMALARATGFRVDVDHTLDWGRCRGAECHDGPGHPADIRTCRPSGTTS